MKTNNNMTPQTRWHDHALDITKLQIKRKKIIKDQKHKTNNRHYDSIPIVPSASKGNLNLILFRDFMAVSLPCNSLHHTTINT